MLVKQESTRGGGEYLESRTQLSVGWDHVFIVNPKWSAHNFMWLKQMD